MSTINVKEKLAELKARARELQNVPVKDKKIKELGVLYGLFADVLETYSLNQDKKLTQQAFKKRLKKLNTTIAEIQKAHKEEK